MNERGDQVGVVNFNRKFDENILVSQVGFLQPGNSQKRDFISQMANLLLGIEFVLLESSHKLGRQTESPETQTSLSATADVVNKSHGPFVHRLLVKVLVLNHVQVDEIAHVGARVPTNIIRIDIDLAKHPDHLRLVDGIGLCAGSGSGRVRGGGVKVRLGRHLDDGEGKAVRDLDAASNIHTNNGTGDGGREGLGTVFDDLHDHLDDISILRRRGISGSD